MNDGWLALLDEEMLGRGFSVVEHPVTGYPRAYELSWHKDKMTACNPELLIQVGVSPEAAAEFMTKHYYGFFGGFL